MQTVPGSARASNRAAMLTPSPKIIVTVDDHVTEINADPELEAALARHRLVDLARRTLDFDRAPDRVNHAGEIRQHTVPCGADDPPAMGSNQRVESTAKLAQRAMCAGFILAHQTAEPDRPRAGLPPTCGCD